MRNTVYVFARAPRLGAVKRRLAGDVGDLAALRFYRATLARTLRVLAVDRRFHTVIAVASSQQTTRWPVRLPVVGQCRGNLGLRMDRIARRHRRGRVAIVGSDIPGLRADDVAHAFRLLGRASACFGPATDGGYWLVALAPRRPSEPFASVRWSTGWALDDTLANFVGRPVVLLRELSDVDNGADLAKAMAA